MNKTNLLFMAFFAVTVMSCRKELAATEVNQVLNGSQASTSTALSLTASKQATRFGALIGAPSGVDPYAFDTDVANSLSLSCLRDKAPVPGGKKVKLLSSGYDILLNFTTVAPMPMQFRTDVDSYKQDLTKTLSSLTTMPKMAVIENEESNSSYYNGSANDYITELKAAISVMHSYGIPVANGGLTSTGLASLVYQDLMNQGLTQQAYDYKAHMGLAVNSSFTTDRSNFVNTLLKAYAKMDLDYVNFHWRLRLPTDAIFLEETINYLKKVTGKPVITNELGQYDQDPATVTAALQACTNTNLSYVLWYSCPDSKSYPLQNNNQSLTSAGYAYRNFILGN